MIESGLCGRLGWVRVLCHILHGRQIWVGVGNQDAAADDCGYAASGVACDELVPPVIPAMPPGMVTMLGLATLTPALPVKVSVPPVTVVVAGIAGGALIAAAVPVMCMVPLRGTAGLPAMAMLPFVIVTSPVTVALQEKVAVPPVSVVMAVIIATVPPLTVILGGGGGVRSPVASAMFKSAPVIVAFPMVIDVPAPVRDTCAWVTWIRPLADIVAAAPVMVAPVCGMVTVLPAVAAGVPPPVAAPAGGQDRCTGRHELNFLSVLVEVCLIPESHTLGRHRVAGARIDRLVRQRADLYSRRGLAARCGLPKRRDGEMPCREESKPSREDPTLQ